MSLQEDKIKFLITGNIKPEWLKIDIENMFKDVENCNFTVSGVPGEVVLSIDKQSWIKAFENVRQIFTEKELKDGELLSNTLDGMLVDYGTVVTVKPFGKEPEIVGTPDYQDDEVICEMKVKVSKETIEQMKLYMKMSNSSSGIIINKDGKWIATVIKK